MVTLRRPPQYTRSGPVLEPYVRTVNRLGKKRRYKTRVGMTSGFKKAVVKLSTEHRIDFY